jgi:hypothetical protein
MEAWSTTGMIFASSLECCPSALTGISPSMVSARIAIDTNAKVRTTLNRMLRIF